MKRVFRIIILTLLIVSLAVFLGAQYLLQPIAQQELDKYLEAIGSDIYTYDYENLKIKAFSGSIVISEVELKPHANALDSLRNGIYEDLEEIHVEQLELYFSPFKYLIQRKIETNKIKITKPEIYVFYYPHTNEQDGNRDPLVLDELFSRGFQALEIKKFSIDLATFHSQDILKEEPDLRLDSISIEFDEVQLSPETVKSQPFGISFNQVSVQTGGVTVAVNEFYGLSFSGLDFELTPNPSDSVTHLTTVDIQEVEYKPNVDAFTQLENNQFRSLNSFSTEEVKLVGLDLENLIVGNQLVFTEFQIITPEIIHYVNQNSGKTHKKNPVEFTMQNLVESVSCNLIEITNASSIIKDQHKRNADLKIEGLHARFSEVSINDSTKNEPFGMLYETGTLEATGMTSDINSYYTLETGRIELDLKGGNFQLMDIRYIPKQTKEEFSKVVATETDRFDIEIEQINIRRLDIPEVVNNLAYYLDAIEIKGANLKVYRNKWMDDPEFKYKPLPSRVIRELSFPIAVDSLLISNADIQYEQLGDIVKYEDEQPGVISFNNLSVEGFNLTNIASRLKRNKEFTLNARATFMSKGKLQAQYRFVIPDTTDLFYLQGELDSLPAIALNPVLRNLMLVEIPKGQFHKLAMYMTGTDSLITGTVQMEYENLHLDVLKVKKPSSSNQFINDIGNTMIKRNNLRSGGKYVIGIVNESRNQGKSVFNYSWLGIKSGIISTVVPFVKAEKVRKKKDRQVP